MTTNFFSPLSFVPVFGSGIRDPGYGMGKNQDPGETSRIRNTGLNEREFLYSFKVITNLTEILVELVF
jgi:hypothetical protein